MTPTCAAALEYLRRGWVVVPMARGTKAPGKGWSEQRLVAEDIPRVFGSGENLGLLVGPASGDLADVDLDCEEALPLARDFLPPTTRIHGRKSNPRSHYWYRAPGAPYLKLDDPLMKGKEACLVELRAGSEAHQTLVPPSIHPSGEPYLWDEAGDPELVDAADLTAAVRRIAAGALLARYWPGDGARDDAALALCGWLTRSGWKTVEVDLFVQAVAKAAGDEEWVSRGKGAAAAARLGSGRHVRGFPSVAERFDRKVVGKVEEWLGLTFQAAATPAGAIIISTDAEAVGDAAVAALAQTPGLYQRAGQLCQVVRDAAAPKGVARQVGSPRILTIAEARLHELMASAAKWVRRTRTPSEEGESKVVDVKSLPPGWAVRAVLARGEWPGVPALLGVVEVPVLRRDGTILQATGYDTSTGLLYAPPGDLTLDLPPEPTKRDAEAAAAALQEVVADFPFADAASCAAWLAAVLTPLARFALDGPAPLFLIDKNVRGAGGSLLADAAGLIVTGRKLTRVAAPSDDAEMEKRITALALDGDLVVLLDNVSGAFGWSSLDAALTGTSWNARILGASKMTGRLDLQATWLATGNNVQIEADTARRVLRIRLESQEENPEGRTGFKHPDLCAWVSEERPRLLAAALTILRAYCRAGRPHVGLTPWGSFESWSALVRGAVAFAAGVDPAEGRQVFAATADLDRTRLDALLAGLDHLAPNGRGVTTAAVLRAVEAASADGEPGAMVGLRWAVAELAGEPPSSRRLGKALRRFARRVVGGRMLDFAEARVSVWVVRRAVCAVSAVSFGPLPRATGDLSTPDPTTGDGQKTPLKPLKPQPAPVGKP